MLKAMFFLILFDGLLFFHSLTCYSCIQINFGYSLVEKNVKNEVGREEPLSIHFRNYFSAVSFIQEPTNDLTTLSATHNHCVLKELSAEKRIKSISLVLAVLQGFKVTSVKVIFL